ncbi:MAG: hypothetical protein IKM74_09820 [Bacteroidales bacterium]|nr:hypothetical protein [Bacteroidales bacterium]
MELIIIRGRQNDGKTTTATLLHNMLVERSSAVRLLKTNGDHLSVGQPLCDFKSVIDLGRKRVAIISAGDVDDTLNEEMEDLIVLYRPDILVVCARARDYPGSSYRMLNDKYRDNMHPENEFWVVYTDDPALMLEAKRTAAEKIVNRIEELKIDPR